MDLDLYVESLTKSSHKLCEYYNTNIIYIFYLTKIKILKLKIFNFLNKTTDDFVMI